MSRLDVCEWYHMSKKLQAWRLEQEEKTILHLLSHALILNTLLSKHICLMINHIHHLPPTNTFGYNHHIFTVSIHEQWNQIRSRPVWNTGHKIKVHLLQAKFLMWLQHLYVYFILVMKGILWCKIQVPAHHTKQAST
jgi:hypothetical protein